jgi:hypothetical protein
MITEQMIEHLRTQAQYSSFLADLLRYYERKKTLSPKQFKCVCDDMGIPTPPEVLEAIKTGTPLPKVSSAPVAPAPVIVAPVDRDIPATENVVEFLKEQQFRVPYYRRLLERATETGKIDRYQASSLSSSMERTGHLFRTPVETFTLPVGERIEIGRGLANALKKKLHMKAFFSNLEIVQVRNENKFGYRVDIRFVSGICQNCHFCGKDLDVPISKASGIGPVCAKQYLAVRPTELTAEKIIALIDKYCQTVGVVENVWIPKDKIKARLGIHTPDSETVSIRNLNSMLGADLKAEEVVPLAHKKATEEETA